MISDCFDPAPAGTSAPACPAADWFKAQVLPHEGMLRSWLRGQFPSLPDTDDLIQETYLQLWRVQNREALHNVRAYLFTIARNAALGQLRRSSRAPFAAVPADRVAEIDDGTLSTPETLCRHHERDLLRRALQDLPPRCRAVTLLKLEHELSFNEIALRLRMSPSTAAAHFESARRRCRAYFKDHGHVVPPERRRPEPQAGGSRVPSPKATPDRLEVAA